MIARLCVYTSDEHPGFFMGGLLNVHTRKKSAFPRKYSHFQGIVVKYWCVDL